MTKTLNVIQPFMHLVPGDTFELNEDGSYTAKQHDEFTRTDDSGDFKSSLTSEFTVSADYMKEMAEEGWNVKKQEGELILFLGEDFDNLYEVEYYKEAK